MDKLVPVFRGNTLFYCFIQVKETLFPNVPKSTLRSWMKEIDVSCSPCTTEERDFIKVMLPHITGAFGLISAQQLADIVRHKDSKADRSRHRFATIGERGI